MAIYQKNLLSDSFLLWHTGLCIPETSAPDLKMIAEFFSVSARTASRWILRGLPAYVRRQLVMILDGRMLPPRWKGVQVVHDGLMLHGGHHIPIEHLLFWPFLMPCVDWSRVPHQAMKKGA